MKNKILTKHWRKKFGVDYDDSADFYDPDQYGEGKNNEIREMIINKLHEEWFKGTSDDKDEIEGIIVYLEPTSYEGFIDLDDDPAARRQLSRPARLIVICKPQVTKAPPIHTVIPPTPILEVINPIPEQVIPELQVFEPSFTTPTPINKGMGITEDTDDLLPKLVKTSRKKEDHKVKNKLKTLDETNSSISTNLISLFELLGKVNMPTMKTLLEAIKSNVIYQHEHYKSLYEWKPPRCACCKVFGHVHEECPKNISAGVTKTLKKTSQTPKGIPVGQKIGFKPKQVLTSVDNDVDMGTNEGITNLADKGTNNVSSSNTPIGEKINKIKQQICEGKLRFVDDDENPLVPTSIVESDSEVEVVFDETANLRISTSGKDRSDKGYGTNRLLEQWRGSYPDNGDYDLYDDDMYENHDMSEHLQSICDDLDITSNTFIEETLYPKKEPKVTEPTKAAEATKEPQVTKAPHIHTVIPPTPIPEVTNPITEQVIPESQVVEPSFTTPTPIDKGKGITKDTNDSPPKLVKTSIKAKQEMLTRSEIFKVSLEEFKEAETPIKTGKEFVNL
ncbi:hypothetical protein Tco_0276795 [Tanacetum coccineum]